MSKKIIKSFAAFLLVLCMMLTNFGGWNHVLAEETSEESPIEQNLDEANPSENENKETNEDKEKPQEDNHEEGKIEEENKEEADKTVEENTDETENDGLEISDEVKPEAVGAGIPAPTINKVFYDATSISGAGVHRARVSGKTVRGIIHVTLKDKNGTVRASSVINPTTTTWTYQLPEGVSIAEGDVVTAYQEFDGQNSPEVTANAEPSIASQTTLKMPVGEIWIEKTSSNQVNDDEQAEAVQMLKDANAAIAGDIKSVKFSIDGTDHAYYEVTYTDGSTSGQVEATDLKIKTVTETSAAPTIEKVQVTDGQIIVTLEKEVAAGTKFYFIKEFTDGEEKKFCQNGNCTVEKSTSQEMSQAVSIEGKKVTFQINAAVDLELGREFGIVVKEPHKFRSCAKSEPVVTSPAKVEVRDPKNLTDDDKKAIDKAIRDANTVNGKSKLPDGTGFVDVPAFIEFDKDGNVTIISPNDVESNDWDSDGNPIYEKNPDGTYKLKDGAKVTKFPAKDLLKNIKPDAPAVKLSDDKKNITITPNEKDTDANSISVSYTGKDGSPKTTTATKGDDGTWSVAGEGTVANGVITLPKDKVKGGTDVTATVTDKGGIADNDTTPLTSDPGTLTVKETKADKVEALGGLDPVVMKKWVGDKIEEGFWKDGVKAKDSTKETEVNKLLAGATFTDETEEKRSTSKEGDFTGKIKITFDDKSEIVVEKQMLYVSNHVTSMDRKDKVPTDALEVEFKLGEGTKVDNTDGTSITGPNSYQKYKVKPNTNLKEYKIPVIDTSVVDSINVKPQEGYIDPVWRDSKNGTNFVATTDNNVFTATATKTFKVTVMPNGGKGTEIKDTKKTGETYKLPAKDTFTPPDDNQEFAGWLVGDATTTTDPGTEITITSDTVIKASWKPIEVKVKFQTEAGASGTMEDKTVNKGSKYELPKPAFTPEKDKEFAGWKVGDGTELKQVGEKIDISGDVTLTATWKDIMVKVTYDANKGSGTMEGKTLKKGFKYKLLDNVFKAPDDTQEFKAWEVDGKEVAAGTEIIVDKDTVVKAVWKKIQVKVSYDGNGGEGTMEGKTLDKGSKYTLLDNAFKAPDETQEFDTWEIDGKKVAAGTEITVDKDTVVKALWKKIQVNVTYDANGGSGEMTEKTQDKGSAYTLLPNTFKAPNDTKEFDTWEVNGEKVAPGTKIKVDKDTVIKAIWKDIMVKVSYDSNGGSETMTVAEIKKGSTYKLLVNGFTAPENQEFKAWEVNGKEVAPGTEITVDKDTVVKAIWKDIMVDITFDKGDGSGEMTKETVKKGSKYALPASKFTPPANQEFAGWKVGNESDVKAVGVEIDIDGEIKLTAVYKDKPVTPDNPNNPHHPYYPDYPNNPSKPSKPDTKPEPKPDTETPSQPGPGQEELPVTPKPDGTQEVTPDPKKTDEVEVTVTPEGKDPTKVEVTKDKDGNWISNNPDLVKVEPKTGKIIIVKGAKDVRAIATLKLERGTHHKYLYGYPDGTVRPEGLITRAEAAALIARLAKLDMSDASKPNFKDVPSRWYNSAINAVVKKNLMFANKDGKFRPNEAITRGEFARALFYIDKVNDAVAPFADVKGHEFEKAINQAYGNDRISGYPDGTFKPNAFIKRAEAAKILNHYANRGVDHDGILGQKKYIAYFTDLNETYWGYYEIMEAANSHEYERPLNTRIETWTKIINK